MSKAEKLSTFDKTGKSQPINYEGRLGLVFARVSSKKQETEGSGLQSQEGRCVKELLNLGVKYEKSFLYSHTGGGEFLTRADMQELLNYIDQHPTRKYVVVFDDLKRFARDTTGHLQLRMEFNKRDVILRCLNYNFDETEEGRFVEVILAAQGELERKQNRRQVIQKQRARLEKGYWAFGRRKGYDMVKDPQHGKISVPNTEGMDVLAPALEGFANGTFVRKIDAVRFLMSKGFWTTQKPEKYLDKITLIMKDVFYAGYIEYPAWDVSRRPGHHAGIIPLETFELIQKRLRKNDLSQRVRIDTSPDFPHRGLIICVDCKGHLTGCWFKGRKQKYRRYICHNPNCKSYNKTYCADEAEVRFDKLLKDGRLKKEVDALLNKTFNKTWEDEIAKMQKDESHLEQQKRALESKLSELTDMVLSAKSNTIKGAYEKQVEETALQIEELAEKSIVGLDLSVPYQTAFEKATLLLKKPDVAWKNLNVHEQHGLFFFLFMQKVPYSATEGYQTAKIPYAAMLFEDFALETTHLVEMAGVKPASGK